MRGELWGGISVFLVIAFALFPMAIAMAFCLDVVMMDDGTIHSIALNVNDV